MAKMKLTPFEKHLDECYGPIGTPERDRFEAEAEDAVRSSKIGEAIKVARTQQNLTQEQLGERIGVKKAQISKMEKGCGITIQSMSRVFRALGIGNASLDLGAIGKVALW